MARLRSPDSNCLDRLSHITLCPNPSFTLMNFVRLQVLSFLLVSSLATFGNAQVIRYDFTGTVRFSDDSDPTTATDIVFGAGVSVGSQVTGFFEYDLSAVQTFSQPGTVSGAGIGYDINSPLNFAVSLGGVLFEPDGTFLAAVSDDIAEIGGPPPSDSFAVLDGAPAMQPGFTGTTFLADGAVENGLLAIGLADSSGAAFNSNSLPTSLSLADFDFTIGLIEGTDSGGIFRQAEFSIDTLELASVPEPGCLTLLLLAATGYATVLRKRRA